MIYHFFPPLYGFYIAVHNRNEGIGKRAESRHKGYGGHCEGRNHWRDLLCSAGLYPVLPVDRYYFSKAEVPSQLVTILKSVKPTMLVLLRVHPGLHQRSALGGFSFGHPPKKTKSLLVDFVT